MVKCNYTKEQPCSYKPEECLYDKKFCYKKPKKKKPKKKEEQNEE